MVKRKINVLSNELDQAPKTREAGYGKVVDSMRKEINEAMNIIFLNGSDVIADYMNHTDKIPIKQLLELKPGDTLSFQIKREKSEESGWIETVGHPAFLGDCNNFFNNCLVFQEEGTIKPGEIYTIIVVEKDDQDPKVWKIHAEQLEYPGKGAMLMPGMVFHNPNVSDERFQEIIGKNENEEIKEEIKKQIRENINEEIELEEKENKMEENEMETKEEEEEKKGLGDTIKSWFGKK